MRWFMFKSGMQIQAFQAVRFTSAPFGESMPNCHRNVLIWQICISNIIKYAHGIDLSAYILISYYASTEKEALRQSSVGWNENQPRYTPFIVNFLTTLYTCYAELDRRFAVANAGRVTKKARIKATVLNSLTPISKADVCRILPDVSPTTVEAVLGELVRENRVRIIGNRRATRYLKQAWGKGSQKTASSRSE